MKCICVRRNGNPVKIPAANLRVMFNPRGNDHGRKARHKYLPEEVVRMAERTGFRCEGQWVDEEWAFAQNLLVVA